MTHLTAQKKILVIRTDRIGDVVLSTPVLETLRINFPSSYIAVMVSPYTRELVEGNSNVNEVIIYDKDDEHRGWFSTIAFARRLARKKFDIAVMLHSTNRVNFVAFVAGIRRRIGYDRRAGFLLTNRFKYTKREGKKHEIDYCLDLLRPLGISQVSRNPYVPVRLQDIERADRLLADFGIGKADNFALINPGALSPSKRWPAERFAETADRISEEFGLNIVVVSDGKTQEMAKQVFQFARRGHINLLGKTTLGELAALLKRAKFLVSNDSGPVHLACAIGTPVISLFGRNEQGLSIERWGPVGKFDIALQKDAGCKECPADNCTIGFKCLYAITVEDVLDAARTIQRNIGS